MVFYDFTQYLKVTGTVKMKTALTSKIPKYIQYISHGMVVATPSPTASATVGGGS